MGKERFPLQVVQYSTERFECEKKKLKCLIKCFTERKVNSGVDFILN
jgi:hypothetical protein